MEECLLDKLVNLFIQGSSTNCSRESVAAALGNNPDTDAIKQTPAINPKLQQDIYSVQDTFESITKKANAYKTQVDRLDNSAYKRQDIIRGVLSSLGFIIPFSC